MNKKLCEYKLPEVLISSDGISSILQTYQSKVAAREAEQRNKGLTITMLIEAVSSLILLLSGLNSMDKWLLLFIGIVGVVEVIYTAICGSKWYEANKLLKDGAVNDINLENMVIQKAKESMRYTAIVCVTYKNKGEVQYLVGQDYFLPHCRMDADSTIYNQADSIKQSLHDDFSIQEKDIIEVVPLDENIHFSIKPIHGTIQMNAYVFYRVKINVQAKNSLTEQNERRRWMSLERMLKTPDAVASNKDVLDLLGDFPKIGDSFQNRVGNISIIWNITSACSYNCAICATHDDSRHELSAADKMKVLNNIATAKGQIKSLDFAGGDPLSKEETVSLIQAAIGQLGADKVSVTTTGMGISGLKENQLHDQIRHCEITIDAAHSNIRKSDEEISAISRGEDTYCQTNIEQIDSVLEYAETLTINIPVINDDLTEKELEELVEKIVFIKNRHRNIEIDALLIRLMPVGKMLSTIEKTTYEKYNPVKIIKTLKAQLEAHGIPCKLHCSLRVLPCFGSKFSGQYCTMLKTKIGIDCAGNVFACAWGAYSTQDMDVTSNPFYLGSLLHHSLVSILDGTAGRTKQYRQIFSEINNEEHRQFCSVVSYYSKGDMLKNADYLALIPETQKEDD